MLDARPLTRAFAGLRCARRGARAAPQRFGLHPLLASSSESGSRLGLQRTRSSSAAPIPRDSRSAWSPLRSHDARRWWCQSDRPDGRGRALQTGRKRQRGAASAHYRFDQPPRRPSACSRRDRAGSERAHPTPRWPLLLRLSQRQAADAASASRHIDLWTAGAMQQSAPRGMTAGSRQKGLSALARIQLAPAPPSS